MAYLGVSVGLVLLICVHLSSGKQVVNPFFQFQKTLPRLHESDRLRENRVQLMNNSEVIHALLGGHPVSLFFDLPNCTHNEPLGVSSSMMNIKEDFPVQAYSVDINAFEFYQTPQLGDSPAFFFQDALVVRTSKGDMYQLREVSLWTWGVFPVSLTWLDPVTFAPQYLVMCECQLWTPASTWGQVRAMKSQVNLQKIGNFSQLKAAIEGGYNFRFSVRYSECEGGSAQVDVIAGGTVGGMKMGEDGTYATFSKRKIITKILRGGLAWMYDVLTATVSDIGFSATFVQSLNFPSNFSHMSSETFVCAISSEGAKGAVDLYMY